MFGSFFQAQISAAKNLRESVFLFYGKAPCSPRPVFREGKNAATLKQIRAALSFAYKHWDVKNPFAKIDPPLHKEPQIRYLLLADVRRLLDYLKARRQGYGSAFVFLLAKALFQTACRFDELIHSPGPIARQ